MKLGDAMKKRNSFFILAAIILAASNFIPAEAAGKKKATAATGAETPMSIMAPLTATECRRLGGEVNDLAVECRGTKKSCTVATLNNGTHTVCINEAG